MITKQYLGQIVRFDRMIANKKLEIENYESKAVNMVAPTDREAIKSSGTSDKIATFAILMAEESKQVDELVAKRNKIVSQIDGMDNTLSYDILTKFYVLDMDLKGIADKLDYSVDSIKKLKRKAIREFEVKYGAEYM